MGDQRVCTPSQRAGKAVQLPGKNRVATPPLPPNKGQGRETPKGIMSPGLVPWSKGQQSSIDPMWPSGL
eukprot:10287030-Karenia_brevis.AAC.1